MEKQKNRIKEIFRIFSAANPKPVTELIYNDNFTLAIAVILSAQATDISVNKATKELFASYNTPRLFLELGEEKLKYYIRTIGLFNSKAKNIISFCRILVDEYNSQIPDKFEELIKLPGVGRKTANVILNCAFGQPTVAVDTHVYRVAKRVGLTSHDNINKVEDDLLKNIPKEYLIHAHHWLILHGRYVCKAKKTLCSVCMINKFCNYYNEVKSA